MALYGGARDISLFQKVNRELMGNIITQQCVYYKLRLNETKVNMYGEAAGARYYKEPVIFNALIERGDQEYPDDDILGVNFNRSLDFKFFREDLVDADVVPEVGLALPLGGRVGVDVGPGGVAEQRVAPREQVPGERERRVSWACQWRCAQQHRLARARTWACSRR